MASDRERFLGFERVIGRSDREVIGRLHRRHQFHDRFVEASIVTAKFPASPNGKERRGKETIAIAIGAGLIILATGDEHSRRLRLCAGITARACLETVVKIGVIHVDAQRNISGHRARPDWGEPERAKSQVAQSRRATHRRVRS